MKCLSFQTDFETREHELQRNSECFVCLFPAILSTQVSLPVVTYWLFNCILVWAGTVMWLWYLNVHCYVQIFGHSEFCNG